MIDYRKAADAFDTDMKATLLDYKYEYTDYERQQIYYLCRKISRSATPTSSDAKEPIKEEVMRPFFLRSLKVFENNMLNEYFEAKTQGAKIVKDSHYPDGCAELTYTFDNDGVMHFKVNIPKKRKYNFVDQMSYAHEIGHIPEIEILRRSYLEYSETLPLFMEYLQMLRKHRDNREEAFDSFLTERLPIEQIEARNIMKYFKIIEYPNEQQKRYFRQQFADDYKFLESLDFTIQLIDRMQDDKTAVGDELAKVIDGKSLIKTAEDLDIDTTECKRLHKEFKRMS